MRGKTAQDAWRYDGRRISIHSPHARGDKQTRAAESALRISIHSPHASGDKMNDTYTTQVIISIHSPHARGDLKSSIRAGTCWDFNPLPSCEGRRQSTNSCHGINLFQSTPLMRGETRIKTDLTKLISISIHSPYARGDPS